MTTSFAAGLKSVSPFLFLGVDAMIRVTHIRHQTGAVAVLLDFGLAEKIGPLPLNIISQWFTEVKFNVRKICPFKIYNPMTFDECINLGNCSYH